MSKIPIAQYLSCSKANGPGKRAVIWVYGCDRHCENCCNPLFQEFKDGNEDIQILSKKIIQDYYHYSLRGITFSGGEPLHPIHAKCIQEIIEKIRGEINIDIMAFSGYTDIEINFMKWVPNYFDLIIAGPYIDELKRHKGIIASENQKILRYNEKFNDVMDNNLLNDERIIETYINEKNNLIVTGLISQDEIPFFNSTY